MRKKDNYLPVPGEEKNQGTERNNQYETIRLNSLNSDDSPPHGLLPGPYFSDGCRRVDYVLTYHIQKPGSVRRQSSHFSENAIIRRLRRSMSMRGSRAPLQPREDPEVVAQEQQPNYHEDDKRFRRAEFEEKLLEMGLELEKEEGTKIPGIGFLKIHAPWKVLCREAEFMKLKVPTKKVYDVKLGSNIVEKIRLFIHKVTAPLHPNVEANRPHGIKPLSHPFSREKQHLFDLSDRDKFFDSRTRSSIVYEVLKRTRCTRAKYTTGITSLLGSGIYTSAYPLHDFHLLHGTRVAFSGTFNTETQAEMLQTQRSIVVSGKM